ncbi:MAG: ABC transporter permease [Clostridia bacterium]|nr:ABC transporter permease [Clostridia bacterium]
MLKRFFKDLKKYKNYVFYATGSELKADVAGSFLSWLWWILDPLFYMLVYSFVAVIIFRSKIEAFPVFVFIGINCWQFFSKTVKSSVRLISAKKGIVTKVYVPKHVFVLEKMGINGFKMLISFAITIVFMLIYQVPVNFKLLMMIPLLLLLFIITFAVSLILTHFGVFIEDLSNIINVVLQLGLYVSGIFYAIEDRLTGSLAWAGDLLLNCNPIALIMSDMRYAMMGSVLGFGEFHFIALGVWAVIGLLVSWIGIRVIYKFENSYVKII